MQKCPHCDSIEIRKKNFYLVKHSNSKIRRFHCLTCGKYFSGKTYSPTYFQKKPFLNQIILKLLNSGNTQRQTARLLQCSKNTVAKKLLWLSMHKKDDSFTEADFQHIQIDELETIEHTKLKPLTVPICVSHNYKILELKVGKIKAKGHLSEIALKKYGRREDERKRVLTELFKNLRAHCKNLKTPTTITTDAHPLYAGLIRDYFPESKHIQIASHELVKKKRELIYSAERKKVFDPLFALNQRFAMLRADIARLARRSWCTTKKIENLMHQLELYKIYNNSHLPT